MVMRKLTVLGLSLVFGWNLGYAVDAENSSSALNPKKSLKDKAYQIQTEIYQMIAACKMAPDCIHEATIKNIQESNENKSIWKQIEAEYGFSTSIRDKQLVIKCNIKPINVVREKISQCIDTNLKYISNPQSFHNEAKRCAIKQLGNLADNNNLFAIATLDDLDDDYPWHHKLSKHKFTDNHDLIQSCKKLPGQRFSI